MWLRLAREYEKLAQQATALTGTEPSVREDDQAL